MKFLKDLVKENGHKIIHYAQVKDGCSYMSVFNYSVKYGGTYDSFKYYNDFVIEV